MELIFRLIGVIIVTLVFYLVGSFVAWDSNPLNWWLFTTILGRCFVSVYIIAVVVNLVDGDDTYI